MVVLPSIWFLPGKTTWMVSNSSFLKLDRKFLLYEYISSSVDKKVFYLYGCDSNTSYQMHLRNWQEIKLQIIDRFSSICHFSVSTKIDLKSASKALSKKLSFDSFPFSCRPRSKKERRNDSINGDGSLHDEGSNERTLPLGSKALKRSRNSKRACALRGENAREKRGKRAECVISNLRLPNPGASLQPRDSSVTWPICACHQPR